MKRTLVKILAALAAAGLFGALVYAILVAAHVSDPAAVTVYGLTPRRLWATAVCALGLAGVVAGGLALRRASGRSRANSSQPGTIVALAAGLVAALNGVLNLVVATGGPGTGNGVVGGAAALVLGLVATSLGLLARARWRRTVVDPGQPA